MVRHVGFRNSSSAASSTVGCYLSVYQALFWEEILVLWISVESYHAQSQSHCANWLQRLL